MPHTTPPGSDRLMTVRQLADYLNINERTVLKLVTEGSLPGMKLGNQWRFRKAMIDTWLDDQMLGLTPQVVRGREAGAPDRKMLALSSCFQPEQIVPELAARTKTGVVEELAAAAERLELVRDRTWFTGALIERENVLPSATGNGLAFLHTLRRHADRVDRPFMVLGRSKEGVDFDALDGKPTHLFFVLGLKYEELHLPWLQKLTQMLARPGAMKNLLAAPDPAAIYGVLAECERQVAGTGAPADS